MGLSPRPARLALPEAPGRAVALFAFLFALYGLWDFGVALDDLTTAFVELGCDAVTSLPWVSPAACFLTRRREPLDDGELLLLPAERRLGGDRAVDAPTDRAEKDVTRSSSRGVRGRLMITNSSSENTPGVRGTSPCCETTSSDEISEKERTISSSEETSSERVP
ncbi:hypothetical protein BV20DRAFT_976761 [Pilatotrama ljubarskyi]|nr:hypothetical protein BV20DRAFT_976761 [Pilatotrama ljubarskyi]